MAEQKQKFSLAGAVENGSRGFVRGVGTLLVGAVVIAKAAGRGVRDGVQETKAMAKAGSVTVEKE
jgi:hypothetical protein